MEARILLVSLLPSLALAFALAAGGGQAPSPSAATAERVGTTVVESPAPPRDALEVTARR